MPVVKEIYSQLVYKFNHIFTIVYFLMAYPDSLPYLIINPGVEKFIYRGANLMWPGNLNYVNSILRR
jgi:predicted ribosome-associated RNA-binding protein Tma20